MDQVTFAKSQINTEYGSIFIKNISMVDFAIFHPQKGIIGNSMEVDIIAKGKRNEKGFVYDFSHLKTLARNVLKKGIDHALVVPTQAKGIHFEKMDEREKWALPMQGERYDFTWEYECPAGAVYPMDESLIEKDSLEQEIARVILEKLPDTVTEVEIKLREAQYDDSQTYFRYTHGLPLHEGLCQRLFHGHKSQIEVYVGDEKRKDLEEYVVNELFHHDVHIATLNQVKAGKLQIQKRLHGDASPITISYEAGHGQFTATIPADRIFTIADDTSIESLTWQVAAILKEKEGLDSIKVFCYEGINKGSMIEL